MLIIVKLISIWNFCLNFRGLRSAVFQFLGVANYFLRLPYNTKYIHVYTCLMPIDCINRKYEFKINILQSYQSHTHTFGKTKHKSHTFKYLVHWLEYTERYKWWIYSSAVYCRLITAMKSKWYHLVQCSGRYVTATLICSVVICKMKCIANICVYICLR